MDKNAIKKYAIWARNELIERVSQKADQYEINADADPKADSAHGVLLTSTEKKQRASLIAKVKNNGFDQVIEEVAYTWFNRFAALRFMEVNNYLPSRVRVFTNTAGEFKPEILTEAIHLDLDGLDMEKVYANKDANDNETLFKYLIITQCNALSSVLPGIFQKIEDYTELLFPDNLLREGSVIQQMIELIPENDWKDQVQIIGWLYQYYNTEPKDKVFADLKKKKKITKDKIPAATQLFTPDWIVRYMVENSLGRLWVEGHPDHKELFLPTKEEQDYYIQTHEDDGKWHYYLEEARQEPEVQKQLDEIHREYSALKPEDILCVDPCMGSGHILCYLFDVLMQIYEAYGYTFRDAASSIVKNNLYGLDIDDRAAQLAYFSVMMKACQYDKRFLTRDVQPHVYAIMESNSIDPHCVEYFTNGDQNLKSAMETIISDLHDAKEYGSILNVTQVDFNALNQRIEKCEGEISLYQNAIRDEITPLIHVAEALAQKYHVVVTNPPYMANSGMGNKLNTYLKEHYPASKGDLFAVFIERSISFVKRNYYSALITQQSWMFLSSYEKLRAKLASTDVSGILHLGAHAFEELGGEVVQTVAFILRKTHIPEYLTTCSRLVSIDSAAEKEKAFFNKKYIFFSKKTDLERIPGRPYAYWISEKVLKNFDAPNLGSLAEIVSGMTTGNNDVFLKGWTELDINTIAFNRSNLSNIDLNTTKWIPYHKGGEMRKWYGNNEYVVNWSRSSEFNRAKTTMTHVYLKPCITWSDISGNSFAGRYCFGGFMFDVKGSCAFANQESLQLLIGIFNSKVTPVYVEALNPTTTTQVGDLKRIPLIKPNSEKLDEARKLAMRNVDMAKDEWDSFEFSWDFSSHPFIGSYQKIEEAFNDWNIKSNQRFYAIKQNEEKLNRIFIDAYGLQNELTPEEDDKDVTVRKADLNRDIRSFISYAVGCMFGRYSLDVDGLAYAGGDWDDSKYKTFIPDKDAILPITDDEYFTDDIVGRFVEFVKAVYGENTLEENLKFIADALGGKGTSREVIRNYFLKDFFKDHCKTYQKRPIYWLFDSGKKNGFKCLIYMHRYQPDTLARIRTDYVHEQQARYRTAIEGLERQINGATTSERVRLNKRLAKLRDQAEETRVYEEKIHHLADQMIKIDLDDGVKHNYAIFQDVLAKIK